MIFGGRSFSGHERHCVFLNLGKTKPGTFSTASAVSGLDFDDDGRAIGLVDWDLDGDQDVWISNRNAPRLRFLRNDAVTNNHFLIVELTGRAETTNRDAIGARVEVHLPNASPLIQSLRAGEGFLGQSSKRIHFGLGACTTIDKLVIKWPGGMLEEIKTCPVDAHVSVHQGSGEAVPIKVRPPRKLQPSAPTSLAQTESARIPLAFGLPMVPVEYVNPQGDESLLRFDRERPTVINLWASWCQPCMKELHELKSRSQELEKAGIDVFAFSVDGLNGDKSTQSAAQEVIDGLNSEIKFGHATSGMLMTLQSLHNRQIPMRRPLPLPTSFLIDDRGELAVIYKGPVDADQLLEDVRADTVRSSSQLMRAAALPGTTLDAPRINNINKRVETMIRFRLGMDLERSGSYEEAARHYRRVLEIEPSYSEAHNNLGNILARTGRPTDAEQHLRRAIELSPRLDLAHNNLGNVLMQIGKRDEAVQHYRRAAEIDPNHAGYQYSLGTALLHRHDFQSAVKYLQNAVRLDDRLANAHNNLGYSLEQLGKREDAIQSYRRTLELNPKHRDARANLSRALARRLDK